MIWARSPTNFESWEAELQFRVTGRGRIGADGLAFWYTATKGFEGPVRYCSLSDRYTAYMIDKLNRSLVLIVSLYNGTSITGVWKFR